MQSEALLRFAPALAIIALSSCGARSEPSRLANGERPVDSATVTTIQLTSEAFGDSQPIPVQYTCDGADETPPLSWGEPPAGTKSFALVVDDPDAPSGTFRHWGVYDIAPSARSIGGARKVGSEVTNDFGKPGYGGPCPPKGHGPHHYQFKLFALNVDRLNLGPNAKVIDLEQEAAKHALAQGELVGTYERM
jgi:Raf kinase inhibitor-like YbhB/YbcL family protein